jgi:type IX secretion system PorP/SprF family membrane protein
MKIDLTDLTFRSPEPLLNSDYRRALFIPDASFGVHILNKSYFVGISAAQLVQSAFKIGTEDLPNFSLVRNYYLMAGYRFYLSNGYELEPSFLLKTSELNMSQLDITLKIYSMGLWWAGLAYRTGSALSFQIGAKVQKLYFGYAYDYSLSNLQNYTFGTHELILALKFGDSSRRYRWLDRY